MIKKNRNKLGLFVLLCGLVLACVPNDNKNSSLLEARMQTVRKSLQTHIPVIRLENDLNSAQKKAQKIALEDSEFSKFFFEEGTRKPFRSEIFRIAELLPSDMTSKLVRCKDIDCYRIEMYNYALNLASIAVVSPSKNQVLEVRHFPHTQPEIPQHLVDLALEIAINSQEVQDALGYTPEESDAIMERTKTSLNRTNCERSKHLCVAPTFVVEPKALWAIVDLTDHELVGIRWTHVGITGLRITERRLQNDHITDNYCEIINELKQGDWSFDYVLTTSDGIEIKNVRYKSQAVIRSAKLVDWHVSYSETEGFGYSDGVGCPYFSSAAVVAVEPPFTEAILVKQDTIGFAFVQGYWSEGWPAPCNYNYQQRFEFYKDGKFRVAVASLGRGCGDDGMYRPVIRIAMVGDKNNFYEYEPSNWNQWPRESWQLQTDATAYSKEGYQYKIEDDQGNGYYVEPGRGQFSEGSRADNAYVFVSKHTENKDEGETDLMTIGPCCNKDYHQGPEKFIEPNPESISNSSLIMWYVAQIRNDDDEGKKYCWAESFVEDGVYKQKVYPCYAGPMFVPIEKNQG